MTAHKRRGIERWQIQGIINQRWKDNDAREFIRIQSWLYTERRHVVWHRNKKMRELIGPPEFNGPVFDGQPYVGEIIGGRVYNGVAMIHYVCIRGMHDMAYGEAVHRMRRALEKLPACARPALP